MEDVRKKESFCIRLSTLYDLNRRLSTFMDTDHHQLEPEITINQVGPAVIGCYLVSSVRLSDRFRHGGFNLCLTALALVLRQQLQLLLLVIQWG